ncbi:pirin family protein [Mucilaginibacter sp. BJC16-A38]|uniref:pirin family protein n=1 Tax=Mucilaginibacter phenanthrenivorans TaxID=1234842 RepID=UPI002158852F|nr:pirin family protein [Mucilaginibacter phenanthrenivorans]MCR8558821.1 pirin family protein [Mucilaginibacter phenanthrenivorans]
MIQLLKKEDQFNRTIFNGNFIANKPVANGAQDNVKPYSSLFYWSHARAIDQCEFGLHPHEGFEIMTFVLDGNVSHYNTATKVWTPLETGDFQVIQSNSGIQHQERITKGTRNFQIWFDPNFNEAIKKAPSYTDYHCKDFKPIIEDGIKTIIYVGKGSIANVLTPGLSIKRLFFDKKSKYNLQLNKNSSYTFYVLKGDTVIDGNALTSDDAVRISNLENLEVEFEIDGELFYIETPLVPNYKTIWS